MNTTPNANRNADAAAANGTGDGDAAACNTRAKRTHRLRRPMLLGALAPVMLAAAVLAPSAANAAPPAAQQEKAGQQDPAVQKVQYTRGFHIYNLTGAPITVANVGINGDFPDGRPDVGHVLQPGQYDDWELQWNFLSSHNSAAIQYSLGQGAHAAFTIAIDPATGVPSWPSVNSDHGYQIRLDGMNAFILDPAGTVHDIPASQGQAQAAALRQLCQDTNQATCKFNVTSETKVTGPEHQVGDTYVNNSPFDTDYTLKREDTVGQSDSVGADIKAGTSLFDIVELEISAHYNHEWTQEHTFGQEVLAHVPAHGKVWLTDAAPMIRDTGNFTITMGNTTWHLHDVYFDSPDTAGSGTWTLHGTQGVTLVSQHPVLAPVR